MMRVGNDGQLTFSSRETFLPFPSNFVPHDRYEESKGDRLSKYAFSPTEPVPAIGRSLQSSQGVDRIDLLSEFLRDPDPKVRLLALGHFDGICDPRWVLYVAQVLQDSDPQLRKVARETLSKSKGCDAESTGLKTLLSITLPLLENADPLVRATACKLLGNYPQPQAVTLLLQRLGDSDSRVRDRATLALANIHLRFPIKDKGVLKKIKNRLIALLSHQHTFFRRAAVNDVASMKIQEAWPPLTRLLRDRNSKVRYAAMNALIELNPRRAIDSLITMTKDSDGFIQQEAIQKLGELRAKKAVKRLTEIVKNEGDRWFLEEALEALVAIGDLPDLETLFQRSEKGGTYITHNADWALATFAEKSGVARAFLFRKFNSPNKEIRFTALRILALVHGIEKETARLQKSLADSDPRVRLQGAQILSANKEVHQRVLTVLKEIAENKMEDEGLRREAIWKLAEVGGEAVIENINNLISDENDGVRRGAVDALGSIRSERVQPMLVELLKTRDKCVQEQAGDTLYRILHSEKEKDGSPPSETLAYPTREAEIISLLASTDPVMRRFAVVRFDLMKGRNPDATSFLIDALKDKFSEIQFHAAQALGRIRDARAVEPLLSKLIMENVEPRVLAATISALGHIGDKRAVKPLLEFLAAQKECGSLCKTTIKALGQLGDPQTADFLFSYLVRPRDDEDEYESYKIKSTAASALAHIGGDRVINQAKEWLHHSNPDLLYWAISILGGVGDPKATEILISYVRENPGGEHEETIVKNLIQRGDWKAREVIANYARLRDSQKHLHDFYEKAALKAEKDGRHEEAILCYQEFLKMNSEIDYRSADFHFRLGDLYQKIGQMESAKHHWKMSFLYCPECDGERAEKALWKLKGQTPKVFSEDVFEKGVRGLGEKKVSRICGIGACSAFPGLEVHYGPKGERFCAPCERVIFQYPGTEGTLSGKEICPETSEEHGKTEEKVEMEGRDMLFWDIFKKGGQLLSGGACRTRKTTWAYEQMKTWHTWQEE